MPRPRQFHRPDDEAYRSTGDRSRSPKEIQENLGEYGRLTDYGPREQEDWFGKYTRFWTPIPSGNKVRIYRATEGDEIRVGDYVTQNRMYAQEHLSSVLRGRGHVVTMIVNKSQLSPVNPNEFWLLPPK